MTLAAHAFYTATDRVRLVDSYTFLRTMGVGERLVASRLAAILKGSGVGENQDDTYAVRRAELDAQFHALPLPGAVEYWRRIEDANTEIPLEVMARCFRERTASGASGEAERILELIWLRVQPRVRQWAWKVAQTAQSGMKPQLQDDLEQHCLIKLWQELASGGKTFLLERFVFALGRIFQHVTREMMEQAGEWQRPGVETPTRIPRVETESIEATPKGEDDVPLTERIPDSNVQDAFDQVELSDLLDLVRSLPEDQRIIIFDHYLQGRSQKEIGEKLHVSDRMVRYRLKTILPELGVRYQGGKGGNHA
ncbi:MAG: sigma-70 family RNA polymerase sigma factor [Ktedonobacterales bacterium]